MNICSNNHTEICYDSYDCPVCELLSDLAQLSTDYETIKQDLNYTEDALAYYQDKYYDCRNILSNVAPEHLL